MGLSVGLQASRESALVQRCDEDLLILHPAVVSAAQPFCSAQAVFSDPVHLLLPRMCKEGNYFGVKMLLFILSA